MNDKQQHIIDFYSRHPISTEHILAKLWETHDNLKYVRPDELYVHDQDHYGGLAANDALAECTGMSPGKTVVDFCAGLGGPARYWADRYGVQVTGIELNPRRVAGAAELTAMVGLQGAVRIVQGNVLQAPLEDASADIVVSQEALLHVPNKATALNEAYRILKPGGRLAFTDWIVHQPLAMDEAESMWQGIAAQTLQSMDEYRSILAKAGFTGLAVEDLTDSWGAILTDRLAMYQALREETRSLHTPSGDDAFYESYVRLVDNVRNHVLGGGRFSAEKPL